jgi:poly-gamma-glutamate capsule biosynthesis protein CapA/YwtB (metallophosphatase superfamily)
LSQRKAARPTASSVALALIAAVALSLVSCFPSSSGDPGRETAAPPEALQVSHSLDEAGAGRPLTLLACGDVLFSRTVAKRIEQNGYQWPFRNTRELVSGADIAFCNLENPVSFIGTPYPGKPENVTFRANPGSLFGLKWAGFDVVSLANNHMNDYGGPAIRETLDYLDMLGISHAGAGVDALSSRRPAIIVRNGTKVAILAYVENEWGVIPAGEQPGVALADPANMAADIAAVRDSEHPDYIVVSVHWGEEHQGLPVSFQKDFGHAAIDAGATLVLGHHPHVLQSLEVYKGHVIAYSLGNFVFDMAADGTYDTAALRFSLAHGRVEGVEIVPLRIERYDYSPRPAKPAEAERILSRLKETSRTLGATVEFRDGYGYVRMTGDR